MDNERILLKRVHGTIPEPLFNKLLKMNAMSNFDEILTKLLYDYCDSIEQKNRNGVVLNAKINDNK